MSARKARSDSKLKKLPEKVQTQLRDYIRGHSLRDTAAWCPKELKVETSTRALSEFRDWYDTTKKLENLATFADQFKQDIKAVPDLDLGDDTIGELAQMFFEMMALKTEDPKLHVQLRHVRLREQEQEIKVRSLEQKIREYEDQMQRVRDEVARAKRDPDGGLSPEAMERIEEAAKIL